MEDGRGPKVQESKGPRLKVTVSGGPKDQDISK